ncbi:ParB N-terminal domain-containing protein [Streptomyces monticola]|uniref:ParB N-terminal domain-containing protein n=1 Tax=Streptomyces monticola TaxID=2666263 RepID=A0ABW2JBQ4_9ACTN
MSIDAAAAGSPAADTADAQGRGAAGPPVSVHASTPASMPVSPPVSVPVDALLDGASPRLAGVDENHARLLAESQEPLPPILVHRPTMRVIDGAHRLRAARLKGLESVEVSYFDGTEAEAFLLAVEANIRHGLPLTLADRKESARRVLRSHPQWSDRAIAVRTGLSGKTVGALRRASALESPDGLKVVARVGNDGRVRALDPAEGRIRCRDAMAELGEGASLREIAAAAGVSVETARDVRERLRRGESPLPARAAQSPLPAQSLQTPRRWARPTDPAGVLDSLRRDPALCYSNEGRAMVRWLEVHVIRREEAEVVRRAPTHRATQIAALARACAASWQEIAVALEARAVEQEPRAG